MSNVYYRKINNMESVENINKYSYELLNILKDREDFKLEKVMPLKVHFGESGNVTYIKSEEMEGIKKFLVDNKVDSLYIETNVLYKSRRTTKDTHIELAIDHGFNDLDIVIADGNQGELYNEVEVNSENFKSCKIGKEFENYNGFVIVSHFKGHGLAGFGGAIKQLSMGFASRGGKLAMHGDSVPVLNKDLCVGCGKCFNTCPVNAIHELDGKYNIDNNICIGCASCTPECPVDAITNTWDGANFYEKLADYANAAQKGKNNIYISFVKNITEECDCRGIKMSKICDDIGILASTDPISLDVACLDLVQNKIPNLFENGRETLRYGEKIGIGKLEYNLIEV